MEMKKFIVSVSCVEGDLRERFDSNSRVVGISKISTEYRPSPFPEMLSGNGWTPCHDTACHTKRDGERSTAAPAEQIPHIFEKIFLVSCVSVCVCVRV